MKKIFLVLAIGFSIVSCSEADKSTTETTASSAPVSTDQVATIPNAAPQDGQQAPVDTANLTTVEWLDGTTKNFGTMKEGEMLDVSFRFKNTGNKPLIISNVTAGCGCTVPETPKKPYAPGETGIIKASFNSAGKPGSQSKPINVFANVNPTNTTLTFNVEVKTKS